MKLEAVVLAAGSSRRFAGIKQLAMYQGQTLLQHTLSQYFAKTKLLKGIEQLTVVLGANESVIRQLTLPGVVCFTAPNWQRGMGASLADFIKQVPQTVTHVLVGLADQVALTTDDLLSLIHLCEQQPEAIVCAQYGDVQGVPAIFPRSFFKYLIELDNDKGARALIQQHAASVRTVNLPNAAIDIDTPEQLQRLQVEYCSP